MTPTRIFFTYVPHIAFVILLYNFLVIFLAIFSSSSGLNPMEAFLATPLIGLDSVRGEPWTISLGHLFIIGGIVALAEEVIRAANVTKVEIIIHGLSVSVFSFSLIELLLFKGFATATFLIICFLSLVDTVAGFTIAFLAARRDLIVTQEHGSESTSRGS